MSVVYQKVLVLGTLNLASLSCGFTYGHLSGMIRSLQKNEDDITLSEREISVIATSITICTATGITLLALFGERVGRRWSYTIFSLMMLVNWILAYYSNGFKSLLLSRVLAGTAGGSLSILNLICAAEFTTPKTRAFFQSMVSMVAPALGMGLGHTLGVVIHWRLLTLAGMIVSIATIVLPLLCVESPQWLASKGRFQECEVAFRKLHGTTDNSEEELRLLIKMESNKQRTARDTNTSSKIRKVFAYFKKTYFWSLMLTNCVVYTYYSAAGKVIFTNLATVILSEMTGNDDVLYYTILVDIFILIGTCVSCVLIKKLPIRTLLFSSGCTANVVLLLLSVCLYFKNTEIYFQWISVVLLALYFIIVHAGPYPCMEIMAGELFPLDIKLICFFLSIPCFISTVCVPLVLMPLMVNMIGYSGLFLLNALVASLCLGYFWWRMPETKGKTLQEIEAYFRTNDYDVDKAVNGEIKPFI